eukprot:m.259432 g.259432  ORF g.259432 m.259432 type:complete len:1102 (+) comp40420_c0_seq3:32-3337(+)
MGEDNSRRAGRCSRFIAHYPWAVLLIVIVLLMVCGVLDYLVVPFPDFGNPGKGFSPRGTDIVKKSRTVQNIKNYTEFTSRDSLFNKMDDYSPEPSDDMDDASRNGPKYEPILLCATSDFLTTARLVFEADFTLGKIQAMCKFSDDLVRSRKNFSSICLKDDDSQCCPDVSLGTVIAAANNVSSCNSLRQPDVDYVKMLLTECADWYGNDSLTASCAETQAKYTGNEPELSSSVRRCLSVPSLCARQNTVYIVLHYLVNDDFSDALVALSPGSDFPTLTYAMTLYQTLNPLDRDLDARPAPQDFFIGVYDDVLSKGKKITYGNITTVGHNLGISFRIFSQRVLSESIYFGLALAIIFIIMWLYTQSFFITSMGCLSVVFAMVIAYFLYHVIFRVPFFGYLNTLSFIVVIGVGADDVFVYLDVWRHTKGAGSDVPLAERVGTTLRHAALAMFVTSFTTATAFYANAVSAIASVQVFGIFAGTTILVNYVLMITWLPAVVVIHEKYFDGLCCRMAEKPKDGSPPGCFRKFLHGIERILGGVHGKVVPEVVLKFRYFLVILFGCLAVGATIVVFYKPRLRLPSDVSVVLFVPSEPLATYGLELADKFYFEQTQDPTENEDIRVILRFVWGVTAEDRGNHLDPDDVPVHLTFEWDKGLNFTKARQKYFLDFCRGIQNESFYLFSKTCFAQDMADWLTELRDVKVCADHASVSRSRGWLPDQPYDLCCNVSLPTEESTFDTCLTRWANGLDVNRTTDDYFSVKFDYYGNVKAVTAEVVTNLAFNFKFREMEGVRDKMNEFMAKWNGDAYPTGLRDGWVSAPLDFYDTQQNLFSGTLTSLGVALCLAFVVLFLTTFNIVISFYAILTITFVLACTIGTLVLLGWELNVIESVTVSIAVGLAVDFTVHFGVAYRLCPEASRKKRTLFAIYEMGPAITMAALTTFAAGVMMMPVSIINLFQIGIFLMLIMSFSWLYANFFFLPLCAIIGPQDNFGQVPIPKILNCYDSSPQPTLERDSVKRSGKSKLVPEQTAPPGAWDEVFMNGAVRLEPVVDTSTSQEEDAVEKEVESEGNPVSEPSREKEVVSKETPVSIPEGDTAWTSHGVQVVWC